MVCLVPWGGDLSPPTNSFRSDLTCKRCLCVCPAKFAFVMVILQRLCKCFGSTMFAEILLPEKVSYLRIQGKRSVPQETFEVLGHKRWSFQTEKLQKSERLRLYCMGLTHLALGRVDIWSGERASRYLWKCQHYLVWAKLFAAKQSGLMTTHEW